MMNKYQEALNKVYELISDLDFGSQSKCAEQLKIIQKLVDKETPKKVKRTPYKDVYGSKLQESVSHFYNGCPNCKDNVGIDAKWCRHCGQKLDWSNNDE